MLTNKEPKILLDSDVVRHFLSGKQLSLLSSIFPNRLIMLDKVRDELCRSRRLKKEISDFIVNYKIPILSFPKRFDIIKEYSILRRSYGEGESACMAVARYDNKYIASSNLKDIRSYCNQHHITYYTTMDLLLHAVDNQLLSEAEADFFIYNVTINGSILPCNSIEKYRILKAK